MASKGKEFLHNRSIDSTVAPSPALTQTGDRKRTTFRSERLGGLGGGRKGEEVKVRERTSDRWLLKDGDEEDYQFIRLLHRSHDHGITAACETADERYSRARLCKTTG